MRVAPKKNPLIVISFTFGAGILTGKFILPFPLSLWVLIAIALCTLLFFRFSFLNRYLSVVILIGLLLAGALRFHLAARLLPVDHLCTREIIRAESVQGVIQEAHFSRSKNDRYVLAAKCLYDSGCVKPVSGKIFFQIPGSMGRYQYGDELRIYGQLERPPGPRNPGQFDYREYLASQDIYHLFGNGQVDSIVFLGTGKGNWFLSSMIIPIGVYFAETFDLFLNAPTAGLLNALITGEKLDLDQETINQFKELGVIHVLAISGLHVAYIILFVFTLFALLRFSQKTKVVGLSLVLIIYVTLVRFISPVLRSALMALLFLFGEMGERKAEPYNIIAGSALLILLWEPRELFNVGFQFSFLGVISLIYGHDRVEQLLPLRKWLQKNLKWNRWINLFLKWIWGPFQVSVAAVLINLPLTMYYYGAIPTYAILANLIVIPMVGLIVFLGIFLLIGSGISSWLSAGIGEMINMMNHILSWIVSTLSRFPAAYIEVPFPAFWQVVIWTVAAFLFLSLRSSINRKVIVVFLLFQTAYFLFRVNGMNPNLQVAFLDVGQGDASLVTFPNRTMMLIDAGDVMEGWDSGLNTVLPFLKTRGILHLQYAVASHPHDDHIGGFYRLLEKINVDTFVVSHYSYHSQIYNRLLKLCRDRNIFIRQVKKGDYLYPDPSCRVFILHPDSIYTSVQAYDGAACNNTSLVIRIQYGQNQVLFPGDLQMEAERGILYYQDFLESEIIKIAHHGAANATSPDLLQYVQPLCAVIPVAKKNKFKHPSPHTLDRLKEKGIPYYQTCREGAVLLDIGPEQIRKINWHNR